jgi:hypothetical protein
MHVSFHFPCGASENCVGCMQHPLFARTREKNTLAGWRIQFSEYAQSTPPIYTRLGVEFCARATGRVAKWQPSCARFGRGQHFQPLNWPRRGNRRAVRIIDYPLNNLPPREERQLASKIERGLHRCFTKKHCYLIGI